MQLATQSLEQMMRDLSVAYHVREQHRLLGEDFIQQDLDADWDARTREWKALLHDGRISIRAILEASL
ncbi:hypothetical protein [Sphingobium olei]|uniref:Uncharacterized protein n=1 Tax=Sphingobium olei TaxID=420955 RepID=A0ABW3NUM6_9SPHN